MNLCDYNHIFIICEMKGNHKRNSQNMILLIAVYAVVNYISRGEIAELLF